MTIFRPTVAELENRNWVAGKTEYIHARASSRCCVNDWPVSGSMCEPPLQKLYRSLGFINLLFPPSLSLSSPPPSLPPSLLASSASSILFLFHCSRRIFHVSCSHLTSSSSLLLFPFVTLTPTNSYSHLCNKTPSLSQRYSLLLSSLHSVTHFPYCSLLNPVYVLIWSLVIWKLLCPGVNDTHLTKSKGQFLLLGLGPSIALYSVGPRPLIAVCILYLHTAGQPPSAGISSAHCPANA